MSRALAFWNDETISLIRENFVSVAVPTWVRNAEGLEGDFLRKAGIDKMWITSSGYMTCVSASGKYLGRRPTAKVLDTFKGLPLSERAPGVIEVPDLPAAQRSIPPPPENGLVARVHARFLHREPDGTLHRAKANHFPLMANDPKLQERWRLFLEPNTEYLWLTEAEWRSLIPESPRVGQRHSPDRAIVNRLAQFHLTPKRATTSEGGIVNPKAIKTAALDLTVTEVTDASVVLKVGGRVRWGSDFNSEEATSPNGPLEMGYETELHGRIEFDRRADKITRFDLVAPGDVWGRWGDANRKSLPVERPGRAPFGFCLELSGGETPTDRIPPCGNGQYVQARGYFVEAE